MEENLEKRFGMDAARIMAEQSEMIFKARHEICDLNKEVDNLRRSIDWRITCAETREKRIKELELSLAYACRLFNYACSKQKVLLSIEEIEEALGERPEILKEYQQEAKIKDNI